jgi:tryptophan-rich sensory protein
VDIRRWGLAVGPVLAAAGLGGLGAKNAPETYRRLGKPGWAPPAGAFGPVWSALYVGIGAAGWRLSRSGSTATKSLHLAQLALCGVWPVVFFGVRDKRSSLLVIALLDAAVTAEVVRLRREDPTAAVLLLPYLAWNGFATALNAAVSDPAEQTVPDPGRP